MKQRRFLIRILAAYFFFYVLFLLLDLHIIPLVWFDEVMGLDPAVNFVYGEGLQSNIWPQKGTEIHYMAYLPLRSWMHIINLSFFPVSVYFYRLPWIIYGLLAYILFFRALRKQNFGLFFCMLVTFALINDQIVFEMLRSMRVDALAYLCLCLGLYAWSAQFRWLMVLSACLMFLVHPYLWCVALVIFIAAGRSLVLAPKKKVSETVALLLLPVLSVLALFFYIHFDLTMFMEQLLEHGQQHNASGGIWQRITDHFVKRFWPLTSIQIWMPFTVYLAFIVALTDTIKGRWNAIAIALLATHIFWILSLAPFYRYNGVLIILSFFFLSLKFGSVLKFQWTFARTAVMLLLLVFMSGEVMARHAMAFEQRKLRDPKSVLHWLNAELEHAQGKTLLFGSAVAYYATIEDPDKDFMLSNSTRSKFSYGNYNQVYFLSHGTVDNKGITLISKRELAYKRGVFKDMNTETYQHLYLYQINSKQAYDQLPEDLEED